MSFVPEPWKVAEESPDVEIAEELSDMEALAPPYEPAGKNNTSLFRRYWERLLRNNYR
ncbi:MAG: hypothetical protein SCK29_07280 [Bacillota bacterium]|nr:hypothetical protein [Bacillota bacterium]MDW7683901.1 hypothetical protein [Bacillota bacterium]